MRDFFIWCSGTSVEIVKKCDDKEVSKYSNIGIVVFCVAFLSIFSATYFLSFAFNTEGTNFMWIYFPIGLIWGFIILSLDRAIVSTISKSDSIKVQLFKAVPRITLAIMIGVVVATPLEFKIFEKEVNNVLDEKLDKIVKEDAKKKYQESLRFWQQKEKGSQVKYDIDHKMYEDEVTGKKSGIPGKGPRANEYMNNELASLKELKNVQDSLNSIKQEMVKTDQNIDWKSVVENYKLKNIGVIERVKALYSLGGTHLAITLLFVLVELLPLLTKLMSNKGGYDRLILEEEKSKFEIANTKLQMELELKKELLTLENNKQTQRIRIKQQIEQDLQKDILTELAKAQNEIALERVEEFKIKNLNSLNIPNNQQPANRAVLENIFWVQKESKYRTECCFRNREDQDNEIIYIENENIFSGTWNYNQTKSEISINIFTEIVRFEILEITPTLLTLKHQELDIELEFENSIIA